MAILPSIIDQLFQQAMAHLQASAMSSSNTNAVGKLYETQVLWQVLDWMAGDGYAIQHIPPDPWNPSNMVLPAKPSSANKQKFSYFSATKGPQQLEVWTSLQFLTLSYSRLPTPPVPAQTHAALHELDVAVFRGPIQVKYPRHDQLIFGASCKATDFKKDYLRELLGLRRETALLRDDDTTSAPWFVPPVLSPADVAADPPAPVALFCIDLSVLNYGAVSSVGAYTYHFR